MNTISQIITLRDTFLGTAVDGHLKENHKVIRAAAEDFVSAIGTLNEDEALAQAMYVLRQVRDYPSQVCFLFVLNQADFFEKLAKYMFNKE